MRDLKGRNHELALGRVTAKKPWGHCVKTNKQTKKNCCLIIVSSITVTCTHSLFWISEKRLVTERARVKAKSFWISAHAKKGKVTKHIVLVTKFLLCSYLCWSVWVCVCLWGMGVAGFGGCVKFVSSAVKHINPKINGTQSCHWVIWECVYVCNVRCVRAYVSTLGGGGLWVGSAFI